MTRTSVVLPGGTIGVMGGGQLGRMFAIAARQMGYRIISFSPDEDSPAGQLADVEITASFTDLEALKRFAERVDVITFEFENIPLSAIESCAKFCEVRPAGRILHIAQNRLREKEFLTDSGLPVAPFARVENKAGLTAALEKIGTPSVLKSAAFGYDGKGQQKLQTRDDLPEVNEISVLEKFVDYTMEISVIVARGANGAMETFPVCENIHHQHILDFTIVPARLDDSIQQDARKLAMKVAERIDLVGLLAVEMFVLRDHSILINEIAPRPHNSGHFSFDACVTSQFEQQVRAVCGLPLGSPDLLRPAAMANLLGDLWQAGEPNWSAAAELPEVKIHLYGKSEPRLGRKMGHLVAFGNTADDALEKVKCARAALSRARS